MSTDGTEVEESTTKSHPKKRSNMCKVLETGLQGYSVDMYKITVSLTQGDLKNDTPFL